MKRIGTVKKRSPRQKSADDSEQIDKPKNIKAYDLKEKTADAQFHESNNNLMSIAGVPTLSKSNQDSSGTWPAFQGASTPLDQLNVPRQPQYLSNPIGQVSNFSHPSFFLENELSPEQEQQQLSLQSRLAALARSSAGAPTFLKQKATALGDLASGQDPDKSDQNPNGHV